MSILQETNVKLDLRECICTKCLRIAKKNNYFHLKHIGLIIHRGPRYLHMKSHKETITQNIENTHTSNKEGSQKGPKDRACHVESTIKQL